jgi:uncharacterized membrane protein YfcA
MWTAGVWGAVVLSGVIGLSLGLIGGGGSIITVPVLVYVAGLPVSEAVALSLAVVGVTAAVGAVFQARAGYVHAKAAILYGGMGMVGAAFGARLTPLVPAPVLLTLFALLMIWVGIRMVRGNHEEALPRQAECNTGKCGLAGLLIGVLTGFLGVGGGFLIVPALMRFAKMPMPLAIGTSLVIIAANSAAGFVAHLSGVRSGITLAAALTAAALAGLFAGMGLGKRMHPQKLKVVFGAISLGVAAYLIAMNFRPLLQLMG